jgi:hypothetical protein
VGWVRLLSLSVIEREPFHEASISSLTKTSSGPFLREILAEKRKNYLVLGNGLFLCVRWRKKWYKVVKLLIETGQEVWVNEKEGKICIISEPNVQ